MAHTRSSAANSTAPYPPAPHSGRDRDVGPTVHRLADVKLTTVPTAPAPPNMTAPTSAAMPSATTNPAAANGHISQQPRRNASATTSTTTNHNTNNASATPFSSAAASLTAPPPVAAPAATAPDIGDGGVAHHPVAGSNNSHSNAPAVAVGASSDMSLTTTGAVHAGTSIDPSSTNNAAPTADDPQQEQQLQQQLQQQQQQKVSDEALIKKIVNQAVQDTIQDETYSHDATRLWSNRIVENLVRTLVQMDRDNKYIVTCMIVQNLRQGMRSATSCFWNAQTDSGYSLTNERNGMYVITTVFICKA